MDYTNYAELLAKIIDLPSGPLLLTFSKNLDSLTPNEWHEIGSRAADFRSAIAFQCVSGTAKSIIGNRWDGINTDILGEADRYVALVKDHPEIKSAFCAYRIENIGYGVAGAVAEMISGGLLGQRGLPAFFCQMFNQNCFEELVYS